MGTKWQKLNVHLPICWHYLNTILLAQKNSDEINNDIKIPVELIDSK